jgi:hypothetical protein
LYIYIYTTSFYLFICGILILLCMYFHMSNISFVPHIDHQIFFWEIVKSKNIFENGMIPKLIKKNGPPQCGIYTLDQLSKMFVLIRLKETNKNRSQERTFFITLLCVINLFVGFQFFYVCIFIWVTSSSFVQHIHCQKLFWNCRFAILVRHFI